MLPHPCREESADHFSFSDPPTEAKPEGPSPPKAMEYGKWAERIKGKYNYFGRPEDVKFGPWSRKNSASERGGTPPPPELRKAAGKPPAARSAEISPAGSRDGDRHASNGSRATSIAKYRQEMLDLVRDMPENSYELSLIDIVESPKVTEEATEPRAEEEEEEDSKRKKKEKKAKKGIMRRVSRSESLDSGGLMLKMFIPRMPVVLGGKRQASSKSGKVSPSSKPSSVDGDREGERGRRRELGERVSSTASSSRNSNSSSSTASSSRNSSSVSSRLIGSCYPFAHRGKSMGVDD
ncbi:uncharacterized protein M6B38_178110 [Iris pallida]|uniref:Uncharacterized protein n=1 Tax=Iris pallida TaxID=29817 RepID=A0AAX6EP44_IRIPA|nr:uncharacterized protein M6B38_178110 [Iris pallida]